MASRHLRDAADRPALQAFYDKIRPAAFGWRGGVDIGEVEAAPGSVSAGLIAWFLGCVAVYASLFATGYLIYGRCGFGFACLAVVVSAGFGLYRTVPKIGFWTS